MSSVIDASNNTVNTSNCGCFSWNYRINFCSKSQEPENIIVQDNATNTDNTIDPKSMEKSMEKSMDVMPILNAFSWEENFFKKFEWLNHKSISLSADSSLEEACEHLQELDKLQIEKTHLETSMVKTDPSKMPLFLYFVGLENNKILLHATFKKPREQILKDCVKLYEYAKINAPQNIVYVMENIDLYDVDKHVKMFMQMFGLDDCRGGSYTDVILPDYMQQTLQREFETTKSIDYYIQRELLCDK